MLLSYFRRVLTLLLVAAVLSTTYLYLYPIFHGCTFLGKDASHITAFSNTFAQRCNIRRGHAENAYHTVAPFRLLVLADPQIEGDSSLPDPHQGLLPRLWRHWNCFTKVDETLRWRLLTLTSILQDIALEDLPRSLQALRKRIDLLGNDYYLAHIYRTLHWWTGPTHVAVLGDLIGSQWVTDEEFAWRGWRYWKRVFANGNKVDEQITNRALGLGTYGDTPTRLPLSPTEGTAWSRRIINIAGNHDIGYAGDISEARLTRFEKIFGPANWDVRFQWSNSANDTEDASKPSLHLIVLNSLNLDTPALSSELQSASYGFINSVITSGSMPVEDRSSFTLLLTHLPLHKPAGVCVDAPHFDFFDVDDDDGRYKAGGLKAQNHLSDYISKSGILEGIFGMSGRSDAAALGKGRHGLILTGHDHEGCDSFHYIPSNSSEEASPDGPTEGETIWESVRWRDADANVFHTGVREVTLRSMMGEYGGNAGLLSAWFDVDVGEWRYDLQTCQLGVQHIWWAIHVLDLVTLFVVLAGYLTNSLG